MCFAVDRLPAGLYRMGITIRAANRRTPTFRSMTRSSSRADLLLGLSHLTSPGKGMKQPGLYISNESNNYDNDNNDNNNYDNDNNNDDNST